MAARIPERLAGPPGRPSSRATATFVRGRTLTRGLLPAVRRQQRRPGRPGAREARTSTSRRCGRAIQADPGGVLRRAARRLRRSRTTTAAISRRKTEILREFRKAGARIFESRLSPFHTGSMSVRGVGDMLYAPKASMPRDVGGPLRAAAARGRTRPTTRRDSASTRRSTPRRDFQTVMHCWLPEAEAHCPLPLSRRGRRRPTASSRSTPRGASSTSSSPSCPPTSDTETLIRKLHDYKVVVVRGGGVWAVGAPVAVRGPPPSLVACARSASTGSGPSSGASTCGTWSRRKPRSGEERRGLLSRPASSKAAAIRGRRQRRKGPRTSRPSAIGLSGRNMPGLLMIE